MGGGDCVSNAPVELLGPGLLLGQGVPVEVLQQVQLEPVERLHQPDVTIGDRARHVDTVVSGQDRHHRQLGPARHRLARKRADELQETSLAVSKNDDIAP